MPGGRERRVRHGQGPPWELGACRDDCLPGDARRHLGLESSRVRVVEALVSSWTVFLPLACVAAVLIENAGALKRADLRGDAEHGGTHVVDAFFQSADAAALFAAAKWIAGGWGAIAVSSVVLLALVQSLAEVWTLNRALRSRSDERRRSFNEPPQAAGKGITELGAIRDTTCHS